jgi:hypothetical protein
MLGVSTERPQSSHPITITAVLSLIAGVGALILLANLATRDIGWAFVAAAAAVILGLIDAANARRRDASTSRLAIIGSITGLVALVLGVVTKIM